jgi:hypothetical protein
MILKKITKSYPFFNSGTKKYFWGMLHSIGSLHVAKSGLALTLLGPRGFLFENEIIVGKLDFPCQKL